MNDELHIRVTDLDGKVHNLPALEGWRVMEIIKDAGLPLKAECGGALECATCHVYVAPQWLDRLSCQILMSDELNGLEVTIAPEV